MGFGIGRWTVLLSLQSEVGRSRQDADGVTDVPEVSLSGTEGLPLQGSRREGPSTYSVYRRSDATFPPLSGPGHVSGIEGDVPKRLKTGLKDATPLELGKDSNLTFEIGRTDSS